MLQQMIKKKASVWASEITCYFDTGREQDIAQGNETKKMDSETHGHT